MKTRSLKTLSMSIFASTIVFACTGIASDQREAHHQEDDGWKPLFDGVSLTGWHGFNKQDSSIGNWTVVDSMLVCLGAAEHDFGGDLVTDGVYGDFELSWEWKLDSGANTGVMYHVVEDPRFFAPYETGPEYQLCDDSAQYDEPTSPLQETGADYDMYPANEQKQLRPLMTWNSSRIVFKGGLVEHWLNGDRILMFQAWSDDWENRRENSKWRDFPDYGKAASGHIVLQDHGTKAWFRNILIREL